MKIKEGEFMRRKYVVAYLSIFVVGFLLFAPAIEGVPPAYSGQLYSLYGDWLQGKPVGLAVFNVEPMINGKEFTGDLILTIINYSSNSPRVVLVKHINGYSQTAFKIERIPVGLRKFSTLQNGKLVQRTRTAFRDREYYVGVFGYVNGKFYSGGKFVVFEPKKPITQLNIQLKLVEKNVSKSAVFKGKTLVRDLESQGINLKYSEGIAYSSTPVKTQTQTVYLPAGVIHSAPWTKVSWWISGGYIVNGYGTDQQTALWYDSFDQYIIGYLTPPNPHEWGKSGKDKAVSYVTTWVTLDNTNSGKYKKETVMAHVMYELNAYVYTSWITGLTVTQYILKPVRISGLSSGQVSVETPPAVPSYSDTINQNGVAFGFEPRNSGSGWMVKEVTFSFGLNYGGADADVSVTLYRQAGGSSYGTPFVVAYNAVGAKYWYKNNDPRNYELFIHW
ncbi:hypothetical protein [Thermococcus sp.]|uniref:hypothetical protein n=1 Tax=Thermococcus sp. TaxID=35749 RepID=UPI0025CF2534|nr:hypothetical protein [Thermococcus sp.]